MKIIMACLSIIVLILATTVVVYAHGDELMGAVTIDCPVCYHHTCVVTCSGVHEGTDRVKCNIRTGCYVVTETYLNHYACSNCNYIIQQYAPGYTHNHVHHEICPISFPCPYSISEY